MEELFQKSTKLIALAPRELQRQPPAKLDWNWRLNGIVGARGTGKTTLLLQRLRVLQLEGMKVLYVTLDDLYFTEHTLIEVAERFEQTGGQVLVADEVHKYPTWAKELKNVYDTLPGLHVAFSGSSILEIFRQDVDLSRRALVYELPGLSFREYLAFAGVGHFETTTLSELVKGHDQYATELITQFKPLQHFGAYLRHGYYPFFLEEHRDYALTLEQIIHLVVENDLQYLEGFDVSYSRKMLQLLKIIAGSPPFKPNISKLSERIGIHRNTLVSYFRFLDRARLVSLASYPDSSISVLQKPDKVFLQNPNLYHVLMPVGADTGSIRESFFFSQISVTTKIWLDKLADFMIEIDDVTYTFEVGGRRKKRGQLKDFENAFVVSDDLEIGSGRSIPLWLFGFLY